LRTKSLPGRASPAGGAPVTARCAGAVFRAARDGSRRFSPHEKRTRAAVHPAHRNGRLEQSEDSKVSNPVQDIPSGQNLSLQSHIPIMIRMPRHPEQPTETARIQSSIQTEDGHPPEDETYPAPPPAGYLAYRKNESPSSVTGRRTFAAHTTALLLHDAHGHNPVARTDCIDNIE